MVKKCIQHIIRKQKKKMKNKIYKYMTLLSKNVYIDNLDDIVHKYNNTYSTIKIKLADAKPSTYIDFDKMNNKDDPIFNVGDHVRTSIHKNIFIKNYVPFCHLNHNKVEICSLCSCYKL